MVKRGGGAGGGEEVQVTEATGTLGRAQERRETMGFKNGCIIWVIEGGGVLSQAMSMIGKVPLTRPSICTCKFPFRTGITAAIRLAQQSVRVKRRKRVSRQRLAVHNIPYCSASIG